MTATDHSELDAAGEYPMTLGRGRGGGFTQKEFKRRLDAYCEKAGVEKLAIGGRSMEHAGRWKRRECLTVKINDPWRLL